MTRDIDFKNYITAPMIDRKTHIIFLGPPGAGKTTMALSLAQMWGGSVFTASSVLRDYVSGLQDADKILDIRQHFLLGKQYDNDAFYNFLLEKIVSSNTSITMIDGFPRTAKAMDFFVDNLVLLKDGYQHFLFHVFAPAAVCRTRFLSKSPSNTLAVFDSRMSHYQDVERPIVRQLGSKIPTLELPSFQVD